MEDTQDATVARRFLETWFKHVEEGFVQFTYIRDGRVSTSTFAIEDGFELAVDEAVRRNRNGENAYLRVAPIKRIPPSGDRGDESYVSSSPGMWAEVDVAEAGGHKQKGAIAGTFAAAQNWVESLPIKPTVVIHSGGGFHVYWRASEPRDFSSGDWTEGKRDASYFEAALQKRAREFGFGLDTNITRNFACLLRLPGLVNWKRAAGHVVSIVYESGFEYDWTAFSDVADYVLAGDNPETYLYAGRESLSSPGVERGPRGRNDTLKAMVAACLSQGKQIGEVVGEVVSFDLKAHDPPLFMDPSEPYFKTQDPYTNALGFVSSIMQSIQRQAEAAGRVPDFGNAGQIRTLSAAAEALVDDPFRDVKVVSFADAYRDREPYEPHLLESVLPKSTLSVIAGPPKSQKSLLLLELATKLATGEPWFGFRPLRPLRVLLIQFEMSLDLMRRRIHGMGGPEGYTAIELDRLERNFRYSDRCVAVFDRDSFPHYLNFARRAFPDPGAPPDVIVFDPLQNMFGGNENSNAEMFVFLRLLDEYRAIVNPEAATVLLHHANKTNRREMLEDPFNALRGASALRGYYSSAIFVSRVSEESEERRVFFDVRAGLAPAPKTVVYTDGGFEEVSGGGVIAGESQLETWNAERRRQRDRILLEINRLAQRGELFLPKELSEVLAGFDDLPGARRIRTLLSEYATRGFLRFTTGAEIGLPAPDARSNGYVLTEITELVDDWGEVQIPRATHYKDRTNGYLVELEIGDAELPWTYDDPEFSLELIDPTSNVSPFRGRL